MPVENLPDERIARLKAYSVQLAIAVMQSPLYTSDPEVKSLCDGVLELADFRETLRRIIMEA